MSLEFWGVIFRSLMIFMKIFLNFKKREFWRTSAVRIKILKFLNIFKIFRKYFWDPWKAVWRNFLNCFWNIHQWSSAPTTHQPHQVTHGLWYWPESEHWPITAQPLVTWQWCDQSELRSFPSSCCLKPHKLENLWWACAVNSVKECSLNHGLNSEILPLYYCNKIHATVLFSWG